MSTYILKLPRKMPNDKIIEAFKTIPSTATGLDLACNQFFEKDINTLVEAFKAIPNSVTYLDLSLNGLDKLSLEDQRKLLNAIPKSVIELNLNHNKCFEWFSALTSIPENINSLSLGRDTIAFDLEKLEQIKQFMNAIPNHITSLDLAECHFNERFGNEENLHLVFSLIPKQIKTLNLSGAGLSSVYDWSKLQRSFLNVEHLFISRNDLDRLLDKRADKLGDAFPNIKQITVLETTKELGVAGRIYKEVILDRKLANQLRRIGFKADVPPLLTEAGFFVKQNKTEKEQKETLPQDILDKMDEIDKLKHS